MFIQELQCTSMGGGSGPRGGKGGRGVGGGGVVVGGGGRGGGRKGGGRDAKAEADVEGGSSTAIPEEEQDGFLVLAKQLAELSRVEQQSHEALTKRVAALEAALSSAYREIADVRVRNDKLAAQLKAATVASGATEETLSAPLPAKQQPPQAAAGKAGDSQELRANGFEADEDAGNQEQEEEHEGEGEGDEYEEAAEGGEEDYEGEEGDEATYEEVAEAEGDADQS